MLRAEEVLSLALGRSVRLSAAPDRGRALRGVLAAGEDLDALRFPHPALSLTHAGGVAIAARVEGCVGVGIDYEPWRDVDVRVARFFLRPAEQATVRDASDLLRRWTMKEALFKASPGNADAVLTDYEITDPAAAAGQVSARGGDRLRYACVDVGTGHVVVAVCERTAGGPD